jgi:GTP-binding protein
MIPCDSDDIEKEYEILLNELKTYNPELMDKERLLAITKCDMLDNLMIEQMKANVPQNIQSLFISSVSGKGIQELKDLIWNTLNSNVGLDN